MMGAAFDSSSEDEFTFISTKKRKSFGHKDWKEWLEEKQKDFKPTLSNYTNAKNVSSYNSQRRLQRIGKGTFNRSAICDTDFESPSKSIICEDSSESEPEDYKRLCLRKPVVHQLRPTSSKSSTSVLSDLSLQQNTPNAFQPVKGSKSKPLRSHGPTAISDRISKLQSEFNLVQVKYTDERTTPRKTSVFQGQGTRPKAKSAHFPGNPISIRPTRKSAPLLCDNADNILIDNHTPENSPQKLNALIIPEFKTPEKLQIPVRASDDDVLASKILEVESPVNLSPDVVRNFKRIAKLSRPKALNFSSQPKSDVDSGSSSKLSGHISEDHSTPSQDDSSTLIGQTPIAEWILKGKNDQPGLGVEISEFESPKKGGDRHVAAVDHSEFNSEHWAVVGGRGRKKRGLAEQLKRIVARYESSVRMFPHDHRNGKFDEELALYMIIRRVIGREDRLLWTICHNVKEGNERCVMFKPNFPQEIIPGALLKLYQPWKEIQVPGFDAPVITCADFYKICQKPSDLGITLDFVQQLKATPLSSTNLNNSVPFTEEISSTFSSLVPYSIKNQNTIAKQVKSLFPCVDLDICVQKSWPSKFGLLVLVLDSDGIYSLLKLPTTKEELFSALVVGRFVKFRKLSIVSKVVIDENASLFSVLSTFGSKQVFYYNLGFRVDTEWDVELHLEFNLHRLQKAECQRRFIHEIQQFENHEDLRVTVECQVDKRAKDSIVVIDSAGDKMKVELILPRSSVTSLFASLMPKKFVVISFLRIFREIPTLDEFSIVEEQQRRLEGDS